MLSSQPPYIQFPEGIEIPVIRDYSRSHIGSEACHDILNEYLGGRRGIIAGFAGPVTAVKSLSSGASGYVYTFKSGGNMYCVKTQVFEVFRFLDTDTLESIAADVRVESERHRKEFDVAARASAADIGVRVYVGFHGTGKSVAGAVSRKNKAPLNSISVLVYQFIVMDYAPFDDVYTYAEKCLDEMRWDYISNVFGAVSALVGRMIRSSIINTDDYNGKHVLVCTEDGKVVKGIDFDDIAIVPDTAKYFGFELGKGADKEPTPKYEFAVLFPEGSMRSELLWIEEAGLAYPATVLAYTNLLYETYILFSFVVCPIISGIGDLARRAHEPFSEEQVAVYLTALTEPLLKVPLFQHKMLVSGEAEYISFVWRLCDPAFRSMSFSSDPDEVVKKAVKEYFMGLRKEARSEIGMDVMEEGIDDTLDFTPGNMFPSPMAAASTATTAFDLSDSIPMSSLTLSAPLSVCPICSRLLAP